MWWTVFAAACLPAVWLLILVTLMPSGSPGALATDPGKFLVLYTGEWTFWLLSATLCVTPLRRLVPWQRLARVRRQLGLWTFFYACLHLTSYLVFLIGGQFQELLVDFSKRPYITVGLAGFACLMPLALTSNRYAIGRLRRNWQRLHRLVYLIGGLAMVHVVWQSRASWLDAATFCAVMLPLLLLRIPGVMTYLVKVRKKYLTSPARVLI